MHQPIFDLFGQVIITHEEIDRWLETVPRIDPDSPRAAWYVKAYDVVGKITAAKVAGEFDQVTAARPRPVRYWKRFAWR